MKKLVAGLLISCAFNWNVFAGRESGGGNAVVCRSVDGKILHAQLLDLYEARVRYHLSPIAASGDVETDYLAARTRDLTQFGVPLSPYYLNFALKTARDDYQSFMRPVVFTNPGEHLPLLSDQGDMVLPPAGCELEQLAIFNYLEPSEYPDVFRVDREIYNALDSNNRAALVSHELNHRSARRLGEPNSELTRGYVGFEFTSTPLPKVYEMIPRRLTPGGAEIGIYVDYECHNVLPTNMSYDMGFFVLPIPNGKGKRLQLTTLGSRTLNTQTYIDLPEVGWALSPRSDDGRPPVVQEAGVDIEKRFPLQTVEQLGLELDVKYKTGEPVQLNVFYKGKPLANVIVGFCIARQGG
jgi:hypothetical protein